MTLEVLARMVGKGFAGVEARFEAMDTRLDTFATKHEMNERFDKMELHLSASVIRLREDVEYLHDYVKGLERRLKRVEARR